MMARLIGYLRGSVTVEVTGADVERLLTACARRGVVFWQVRRLAADKVVLCVGLDGYFTLRGLSRRAMCRLRVRRRRGAPFGAGRLEKRWGLMLGAALALCAVWYLSGFVWTIEVTGGQNLGQREILAMLGRAGLRTGSRRADVDPAGVRDRVLLMTDALSFLTVNLRGTHATVTVWDREEQPPAIDRTVPCDVVSDKAGVVVALRVREGKTHARVGETLMPGDLIASGTMTSTQGEVWQVHASAEADLRVWHTLERRLPDTVLRADPTGQRLTRRTLVLGNWRIGLYVIETEPYAWYDKQVEKKALSLGESFRLPFMLVTETYTELALSPASIDAQAAARALEAGLRAELAESRPEARIVSLDFEMTRDRGAFVGKLTAECIETAGVERAIE